MKRQSIMDTYKELLSVKNWNMTTPSTKKVYWVGIDPVTGIMQVSCDVRDMRGVQDVREVFAHSSESARLEYASL